MRFFIFSSFVFFSSFAIAQSDSLTNKHLRKTIHQSFAAIATGQEEAANVINYGAVDPVNGNLKLNIAGPIISNERRLAVFFNAGAETKLIGNNIGVLFSDSKLNKGVKINGK